MADQVRFIRKNGRVIPIRARQSGPDLGGAALGTAGVAISLIGAPRLSIAAAKFGNKARIGSLLGGIFLGEAMAAEGIDRFTESLRLKKRTEQNLKNIAGGTIGVLGALSGLAGIKKRLK